MFFSFGHYIKVRFRRNVLTNQQKRKKTSRACNHCHKAHMTCDSNRPCNRCKQRGLSSTCKDAPRKRKKYLADVPVNALASGSAAQSPTSGNENVTRAPVILPEDSFSGQYMDKNYSTSQVPVGGNNNFRYNGIENSSSNTLPQPTVYSGQNDTRSYPSVYVQEFSNDAFTNPMPSMNGAQPTLVPANPVSPPKQRRTNFMSTAADLEYATLSNILQDNLIYQGGSSTAGTPSSLNISPTLSPHNLASNTATNNNFQESNERMHYIASTTASPGDHGHPNKSISSDNMGSIGSIYHSSRSPKCDESINQYFVGANGSDSDLTYPDIIAALEELRASDPAVLHERSKKLVISFAIGINTDEDQYSQAADAQGTEVSFKEPDEIYEKVTKPFSYTPGYHSLIAYLKKRFSKDMLVRMAESIAAYRPSFIACTNSLKESDLIFMEQCFQRTLLTYDNFIKVSGTPTIVWRRTGEIAYVGNEFCLLTGWGKDELLYKKRKFIVELLDDRSVLEYFHLFLKIAFGDFLGATMTECTLLTPKNDVKIRTGCMWTLKRDVFGIPMMIIGNFLPIL